MNVHTPERGANESQAEYRARQRKSHAIGRAMVSNDGSNKGQRSVPGRAAHRRAIAAAGGIRQYKRLRQSKRDYMQDRQPV